MNVLKSTSFLLFSITFTWSSYGMTTLSAKEVKVQAAKEAKAIEVEASLSDDHPAIEEGVTCADCHEIKLDAKTTATQVWLTGEYLGFAKNEGAMNTLNPDTMTLHGIHEKGTAKLLHIKQNPRVSLNWHKEFTDDWGLILCIQFTGRAELIEGTDPEFEKIMIDCIPYEKSAKQRKITLDQARTMSKQMMLITRIVVDEATITNMQFRKEGYRPWQRWTREMAK
jgi:hypothetical protein